MTLIPEYLRSKKTKGSWTAPQHVYDSNLIILNREQCPRAMSNRTRHLENEVHRYKWLIATLRKRITQFNISHWVLMSELRGLFMTTSLNSGARTLASPYSSWLMYKDESDVVKSTPINYTYRTCASCGYQPRHRQMIPVNDFLEGSTRMVCKLCYEDYRWLSKPSTLSVGRIQEIFSCLYPDDKEYYPIFTNEKGKIWCEGYIDDYLEYSDSDDETSGSESESDDESDSESDDESESDLDDETSDSDSDDEASESDSDSDDETSGSDSDSD